MLRASAVGIKQLRNFLYVMKNEAGYVGRRAAYVTAPVGGHLREIGAPDREQARSSPTYCQV